MTLPSTLSMISLPNPQHPLTPHQPCHYLCPQVYFLQEAGSFFKTSGKSGAPGKAENTTGSAIRTSRLGGGRGLVLPGKSAYCTAHNTALQESAFALSCPRTPLWTLSADSLLFFQDFVQFGSLRPHCGDSSLFLSPLPKYPEPTGAWEVHLLLFSLHVVLPAKDLELPKTAGYLARFRVPSPDYARFSQLLASLWSCKRNSLRFLFSGWQRSSREMHDNRRVECVQ